MTCLDHLLLPCLDHLLLPCLVHLLLPCLVHLLLSHYPLCTLTMATAPATACLQAYVSRTTHAGPPATAPATACLQAYVSRTTHPEWAIPCLKTLLVTGSQSMMDVSSYLVGGGGGTGSLYP